MKNTYWILFAAVAATLGLAQLTTGDTTCVKCIPEEGGCLSGGVLDGDALCGSRDIDVPQKCRTTYKRTYKCGTGPNFTYRYEYPTQDVLGQTCEPGGWCY